MIWRNWGRNVLAHPRRSAAPADLDELVTILADAERDGLAVRPVGSGHSFTPIAATTGISLSLDRLSGVVRADPATGLVTLGAGTRLWQLPALLRPFGLALENMGDIDRQTLAGAISTGTHGTGRDFTGLTGQVRGLRMALADGSVVDCSTTQRPELFQAARLGLGAFGVLTEITVQCVPAFLLEADEYPLPLNDVLDGFDEITAAADHVEFYWFPHSDTALVKANQRRSIDSRRSPLPYWRGLFDDEVISNGLFAITCATGWLAPPVIPSINRLASQLVSQRRYTDHSQTVFTSRRRVRFREMEFGIEPEAVPWAIREINTLISRRGWRISFPLEIRIAAADDVWLSTAYGRRTAYIAVHRYYRDPYAEYFRAVQELLLGVGGRPHWGKLHTLDAHELRRRYPRFGEVVAVRAAVDPQGRFRNDYLDRVLGLPNSDQ